MKKYTFLITLTLFFASSLFSSTISYVSNGWHLVSPPTPATFTKDEMQIETIYHYDTAQGAYTTPNNLLPGKGYWVIPKSVNSVSLPEKLQEHTSSDELFAHIKKNLKTVGWNLLGTSFSTTKNEVKQKLGVESIWPYNASLGAYSLVEPINPGDGYWIFLKDLANIPDDIVNENVTNAFKFEDFFGKTISVNESSEKMTYVFEASGKGKLYNAEQYVNEFSYSFKEGNLEVNWRGGRYEKWDIKGSLKSGTKIDVYKYDAFKKNLTFLRSAEIVDLGSNIKTIPFSSSFNVGKMDVADVNLYVYYDISSYKKADPLSYFQCRANFETGGDIPSGSIRTMHYLSSDEQAFCVFGLKIMDSIFYASGTADHSLLYGFTVKNSKGSTLVSESFKVTYLEEDPEFLLSMVTEKHRGTYGIYFYSQPDSAGMYVGNEKLAGSYDLNYMNIQTAEANLTIKYNTNNGVATSIRSMTFGNGLEYNVTDPRMTKNDIYYLTTNNPKFNASSMEFNVTSYVPLKVQSSTSKSRAMSTFESGAMVTNNLTTRKLQSNDVSDFQYYSMMTGIYTMQGLNCGLLAGMAVASSVIPEPALKSTALLSCAGFVKNISDALQGKEPSNVKLVNTVNDELEKCDGVLNCISNAVGAGVLGTFGYNLEKRDTTRVPINVYHEDDYAGKEIGNVEIILSKNGKLVKKFMGGALVGPLEEGIEYELEVFDPNEYYKDKTYTLLYDSGKVQLRLEGKLIGYIEDSDIGNSLSLEISSNQCYSGYEAGCKKDDCRYDIVHEEVYWNYKKEVCSKISLADTFYSYSYSALLYLRDIDGNIIKDFTPLSGAFIIKDLIYSNTNDIYGKSKFADVYQFDLTKIDPTFKTRINDGISGKYYADKSLLLNWKYSSDCDNGSELLVYNVSTASSPTKTSSCLADRGFYNLIPFKDKQYLDLEKNKIYNDDGSVATTMKAHKREEGEEPLPCSLGRYEEGYISGDKLVGFYLGTVSVLDISDLEDVRCLSKNSLSIEPGSIYPYGGKIYSLSNSGVTTLSLSGSKVSIENSYSFSSGISRVWHDFSDGKLKIWGSSGQYIELNQGSLTPVFTYFP